MNTHLDDNAILLIQDRGLAGNLRYHMQDADTMCLSLDHLLYQPTRAKRGDHYLLMWNPQQPHLKSRLTAYLRVYLGVKDFEEIKTDIVSVQSTMPGRPALKLQYIVVKRKRQIS